MAEATEPKSLMRLFLGSFGWLIFFPLLIGTVTALIAMFEGRKADRLESAGAVAQAMITDKEIKVSRDSDGNRSHTYYLHFTFPHEGREIANRESVSSSFYNRLAVGAQTPVRYWTVDPSVSEIEPGSTTKTIWVTKVIAVIALTAAGFWGERNWRHASRAVKLREHGEARTAEVVEHAETNVRINKRPQYRLVWRDSAGAGGQSYMMPGARLDNYPIGSELRVFADPRGKWPSVWAGDVGPRKSG